jgi:hypothetical protein
MSTRPPRRWLLPAGCSLLLSAMVAVEGGCWPTTGSRGGGAPTEPSAPIALAARYVLTTVNGAALPRVVREASDGTITRVYADTLVLAPAGTAASGSYDEVAVLGVIRPGQVEERQVVRTSGRAYTRGEFQVVELTAGLAVLGTARATAQVASGPSAGQTSLFVSSATGGLQYTAR